MAVDISTTSYLHCVNWEQDAYSGGSGSFLRVSVHDGKSGLELAGILC